MLPGLKPEISALRSQWDRGQGADHDDRSQVFNVSVFAFAYVDV